MVSDRFVHLVEDAVRKRLRPFLEHPVEFLDLEILETLFEERVTRVDIRNLLSSRKLNGCDSAVLVPLDDQMTQRGLVALPLRQ